MQSQVEMIEMGRIETNEKFQGMLLYRIENSSIRKRRIVNSYVIWVYLLFFDESSDKVESE